MKHFGILSLLSMLLLGSTQAADLSLPTNPIFVKGQVAPLVMLVMGRDHTLYYEAYNDATDLNGNGAIDDYETHYAPTIRDYYGYFDSFKCYHYSGSTSKNNTVESSSVFVPVGPTEDNKTKTCPATYTDPDGNTYTGLWSGDFLNYLTTSRIDALRKVLYGGYRGNDNGDHPTLQRSLIPQDAHTWGKTWDPAEMGSLELSDYAPLDTQDGATGFFFANTSLSANGLPLLRVLEVPADIMGKEQTTTSSGSYSANYSSMYFKGTPNSWKATTPMTLVGNHIWQAKVSFGLNSSTKKFKFDANGNWNGDIYGDNNKDGYAELWGGDITTTKAGPYLVKFNDSTKQYTLTADSGPLYIWNWVSKESPVAGNYMDNYAETINSARTDYVVRVQVCTDGLLESNCKKYGAVPLMCWRASSLRQITKI